MGRAFTAGMTDYSYQSLEDMVYDLQDWLDELKKVLGVFSENTKMLKDSKYWDKVNWDFRALGERSNAFFETAIKEISEIIAEIQQEVRNDHVQRIGRLGKTAVDLNHRYGDVWHNQYHNEDKEYGNDSFKLVEELYRKGRSTVADMMDLSNLAERLKDFVGARRPPKSVAKRTIGF